LVVYALSVQKTFLTVLFAPILLCAQNITYLVKDTCICRAMELGILELHRCSIWYVYA
jgi:hypothetical protein